MLGCSRCMHPVRVRIGAEGTGNRFLSASVLKFLKENK